VKKEDGDVEMEEDQEEKPVVVSDGEEEQASENEDEDEDEEETGRKRKKKANGKKATKKAKTSKSKKKKDDDDEDDDSRPSGVVIELNSHVSLTFSLKYLVNFAKSTSVAGKVQLMMSNDVPLLVSYDFKQGHIRYYLAPKIGDE